MEGNSFLLLCRGKGYTEEDLLLFEKAVNYVEEQLGKEKRLAGDLFSEHNIRVGKILVENKADPETVLAGLLHGLLDKIPEKEIEDKFGKNIVSLLNEVNTLRHIKINNVNVPGDALRRIMVTALHDLRVIFIKLANKLDNLNSVHVFPPDERERLASEVLEVYAPLAYRLGVERIRVQLEDCAFYIINPKKHVEIQEFLEETREEREHKIERVIELLKEMSRGKLDLLKIKGRPKHIYSIYKKVVRKKKRLNDLFDLLGIRVIVPTEKDCYTFLGLLHEKFEPIEGRLKDYIANPKPNFYRSLHTGVKLNNGWVIEVQIRTPEMEEFAEEGIAAHWRYKDFKSDKIFEKKIAWMKEVLDLKKKDNEFLESVQVDVFGDKIYCYTPLGDLKELPVESTVLDFAYAVHEEIGSKCVGGKVNGKFVPLRHKLVNGDVVEIITHKKQRPRRSWIKIVSSSKARQRIRKVLKDYENLPSFHFRLFKPVVKEEKGVLVSSEEYPRAVCTLAKCCQALPGENIVGLITKRRIISVHRDNCKEALKKEDKLIPVKWKENYTQRISFHVEAGERSGLLADLLHTIAQAGFEVKEAKAKLLGVDAKCSFKVIPRNLEHLKEMVRRVQKVKGIIRIYFD